MKERKAGQSALKYAQYYSVEEQAGENGRIRKRIRYNGPWTVLENTGAKTLIKLACAAVSALVSAVALVLLQTFDSAAGGCWYVSVPRIAALLPGLYMLLGLFDLPWKQKPMPVDRYMHGIIRCCRSGAGVSILMLVSLAGEALYRAKNSAWEFSASGIKSLALAFLAAAGAAACTLVLWNLDVYEADNGAFPA